MIFCLYSCRTLNNNTQTGYGLLFRERKNKFSLDFRSRRLVEIEVLCCSFPMSCEIVWVSVIKICSLCLGQLLRKPKHPYRKDI